MKISELTLIDGVRRDIRLPLSIAGENKSVTLGQILDAAAQDVVSFKEIAATPDNVQYTAGSDTESLGYGVVFDLGTNKFYLARSGSTISAGVTLTMWTYFQNWLTYADYYDESGNVRTDCLFAAAGGRLYQFDGTTLKSAGVTEEQAQQIRLATPIEIADETTMENRIAAGEYEAGQIYFIAEES